jgi:hypothetical protein
MVDYRLAGLRANQLDSYVQAINEMRTVLDMLEMDLSSP